MNGPPGLRYRAAALHNARIMGDQNRASSPSSAHSHDAAKHSPFRLLSVRIAIALTVLGAGMWIYALATAPAAGTSNERSGDSGLASGFSSREGGSTSSTSSAPRAVDAAAPAVLRFGVSFLGAFMIGFFLRKFLRWTLLVVAIIAIAIYFLRRSGMLELPWDQIEEQVEGGSTWLQAQAGSIKKLLTGYLPSSMAAMAGGFIGFMRG